MIKSFLIATASFAILDSLWLGLIMKDFNIRQLSTIGRIENGKFDLMYAPALAVYIFLGLALSVFVLPQINANELGPTFLKGAIMGLIIYGVYDMTNLAILKNYPLPFALVDILWGTVSFGAVTVIVGKIANS